MLIFLLHVSASRAQIQGNNPHILKMARINPLKPKTYVMYGQLLHTQIMCSVYNAFVCFMSMYKRRVFLYTALTYRFL